MQILQNYLFICMNKDAIVELIIETGKARKSCNTVPLSQKFSGHCIFKERITYLGVRCSCGRAELESAWQTPPSP